MIETFFGIFIKYGYWALFFGVALENAGLPLPGETLLLAAGFFAAITCAEAKPDDDVTILEKSSQFLSKVRISGGGRCNVTHACFDARDFHIFAIRLG